MKVITIIGARPQFIKAAVVSRALAAAKNSRLEGLKEVIIHTGQHYDYNMSQVFFEELEIPLPNYQLSIDSSTHGSMTGEMLKKIEVVLINEKPDLALVYGDTNTTLSGALAAVKLHIPVAHVESGLRSFNRRMPEEVNRILTDHISKLLFCPTQQAIRNLENEGIRQNGHHQKIFLIGDVMYDAALYYQKKRIPSNIIHPYAICSIHRAENTDCPKRLSDILSAIEQSPVPILLPLHPRTRKIMKAESLWPNSNVEITEPLSYLTMLGHLHQCSFVITDSGGLQKEAYFFGKKCITIREETEWNELVELGVNRITGTRISKIRSAFKWAMQPIAEKPELYGDGSAANKIVSHLMQIFQN